MQQALKRTWTGILKLIGLRSKCCGVTMQYNRWQKITICNRCFRKQ